MKKNIKGKFFKRKKLIDEDSSIAENAAKMSGNRNVKVLRSGLCASAPGTRRAKVNIKKMIRYNSNVNSYIINDQQETASAISVVSKPQSAIEKKYQRIKVKDKS